MTQPKIIRIMEYSGYGDAKGVCVEYAPAAILAAYDPLGPYTKHHKYETGRGRYSDDVQMEIAIAKAIISGHPITPRLLADLFVEVYKLDPRPGYASGFQSLLDSIIDGVEFLTKIRPDSDKSGACMRIVPAGVYPSERQVVHFATLQAALTHSQPDGINAAIAAALMSHYFLYDLGPKSGLGDYLADRVPGPWAQPWVGEYVGQQGWMSVQAAVTAVMACNSMSELLTKCIKFGGDTDTVATIALGAASCSEEVIRDLPAAVTEGLENGRFGRDFLRGLDAQLTLRMYQLQAEHEARRGAGKTERPASALTLPVRAAQVAALAPSTSHPAVSATAPPRIVAIQSLAMWTAAVDKQDYLQIPADMDLAKEEKDWFAAIAAGSVSQSLTFSQYLISRGAQAVAIDIWNINYQS